jgi:hypothetical protein
MRFNVHDGEGPSSHPDVVSPAFLGALTPKKPHFPSPNLATKDLRDFLKYQNSRKSSLLACLLCFERFCHSPPLVQKLSFTLVQVNWPTTSCVIDIEEIITILMRLAITSKKILLK